MRIHSDTLRVSDLNEAARIARVDMEFTTHGSRKRDHAFNVNLIGESRRRPNGGNRGANSDAYAATWDQWGVFIAALFDVDPNASMTYYDGSDDFHYRTAHRFNPDGNDRSADDRSGYWPADAHGDHRFKYDGIPYEQSCTKCSAVRRWQ